MTDPVILLVEDNEDDIELARIALARAQFRHRLCTARDGVEAVEYLLRPETRRSPPALVLLDLKLPKQDGKAVLRELRGDPLTARVPVIVLTSSRLEVDVLDAYTLGANSYYQKPMDLHTFATGTSILLAYWFQYNVAPYQLEGHSTGELRDPLLALEEPMRPKGPDPWKGASRSPGVIVIDGHPGDRAATMQALTRETDPRMLAEIGSYEEAAELLRRLRGPPPFMTTDAPRLILLDLDLAGGDGRDLLQAIRYRCDHHVLIVVFTRVVTADLASQCYRLKINSLVRKPDSPDHYRSTVQLLWHYWIRMNATPPPQGTEGPMTPRPG